MNDLGMYEGHSLPLSGCCCQSAGRH